MHTQAMKEAK